VNMIGEVKFLEPEVNKEASNFIMDKYSEIIRQTSKMGVHRDKVEDLVHDVLVSIIEAEEEGKGYDSSKGILVSEFVYGRIKKYSKNKRYSVRYVEAGGTENDRFTVTASSCSDASDYEDMDQFQRAYAMAATYDELDDIDETLSIKEKIEYCIGFSEIAGMDILSILKNIKVFNEKVNASLFNGLKRAIKQHDEFASSLREVLEFSIKNREAFETIMETV